MPLVKKVHRATIRYPVFNGTGIPALDQDFGGMLRSTKRAVSSWELASLRCLKAIDFLEKTVIVWQGGPKLLIQPIWDPYVPRYYIYTCVSYYILVSLRLLMYTYTTIFSLWSGGC